MDPENAKLIAGALARTLGGIDKDNAAKYAANAGKFAADLDKLSADLDAAVKPVRDKRYIVFHDAYQYFETRFGMSPAGSITVNPEVMPGAKRIRRSMTGSPRRGPSASSPSRSSNRDMSRPSSKEPRPRLPCSTVWGPRNLRAPAPMPARRTNL